MLVPMGTMGTGYSNFTRFDTGYTSSTNFSTNFNP